MEESKLQDLTLASWAAKIWRDHRRGMPLVGQSGAIAEAMDHHKEWWSDWDALEEPSAAAEDSLKAHLLHVHLDAAIKLQIDNGDPRDIGSFYTSLIEKGFTEFEAIHTLALGLTEESTYIKENNVTFDAARYVERVRRYVAEALNRPNLKRLTRQKLY